MDSGQVQYDMTKMTCVTFFAVQPSVHVLFIGQCEGCIPVSMCGSVTEAVHVFIERGCEGVSIVGLR